MDRREQLCRARFRDTAEWRRAGVSRVLLRSASVVPFRVDSYNCSKTRSVSILCRQVFLLQDCFKIGSNAVISLIFAEYLNRLLWHSNRSDVSPDSIPQWAIQVTAISAVVLITILCVATRNLSARAAVVFTSVKVSTSRYFGLYCTSLSLFL